jgi:hypothetical protein
VLAYHNEITRERWRVEIFAVAPAGARMLVFGALQKRVRGSNVCSMLGRDGILGSVLVGLALYNPNFRADIKSSIFYSSYSFLNKFDPEVVNSDF